MPLRLFRSRNVVGANLVQALLVVGMFGMFFLGALYMQRVLGYDALEVGLAFLPATVVMGTMSFRFSAQLNMRYGPRATLLPAWCSSPRAAAVRAHPRATPPTSSTCCRRWCCSASGAGLSFPSLMTLAMSGATPEARARPPASSTRRVQVGGAIGLAVLATLATEQTNAARRRRVHGLGAQLRLSPCLPGGLGADPGGDRDRPTGIPLGGRLAGLRRGADQGGAGLRRGGLAPPRIPEGRIQLVTL